MVGPGYCPIPEKLVTKIKAGQFNDLLDLLPKNVKAQDSEPQTYLDGKLLVSTKKRVQEITDIATWVAAFIVFIWILCCTHPSRWQDMTQYKLLILQTAHKAWLHYGTAFRKDAAASGLTDWPVGTAICTTFIPAYLNNNSSSLPPLHPHLQDHLPLHLISADPGIMAPVPGPTVNVGTVTAVKTVKESIHEPTAPFRASASLAQRSRSSSSPRSKRQRHWDHGHHMSFGQGTLLANFDVKSAYWNIPVHPEDRYLLGMKW